MREIKFRIYDKEHLVMIYFNGIFNKLPTSILIDQMVMQFTGLKDKNGIEIYEGDIISVTEYFSPKLFTIKFEDGAFIPLNDIYHGCCNGFSEETLEVKGNIYENPELLLLIR